jgi:hypothetical protein
MPLWNIYHPPSTFQDDASKQALARDIVPMYAGIGLPAFYVTVNFIPMAPGTMYIGGERNDETRAKPFVRFAIDHIAVRQPDDDAQYRRVVAKFEQIVKPHVADKGYNWEFHIAETERRLWGIDGFEPPPFGSEGEKLWVQRNEAVPWKGQE